MKYIFYIFFLLYPSRISKQISDGQGEGNEYSLLLLMEFCVDQMSFDVQSRGKLHTTDIFNFVLYSLMINQLTYHVLEF